MAATVIYDGAISGGAIATVIGASSGATIIPIPNANGMRVLIIQTDK